MEDFVRSTFKSISITSLGLSSSAERIVLGCFCKKKSLRQIRHFISNGTQCLKINEVSKSESLSLISTMARHMNKHASSLVSTTLKTSTVHQVKGLYPKEMLLFTSKRNTGVPINAIDFVLS